MITRYNVNFTDHMIEIDPEGRFVKFADYAQAELLIDIKVEETVVEKIKEERAELNRLQGESALLNSANEQLDAQVREMSERTTRIIGEQARLIKAAKDRLHLLGHSPTCGARYKAVSAEGQTINGECNCGLEEWFTESGVKHG